MRLTVLDVITRPAAHNGPAAGRTGGTGGTPRETQHILRPTTVPPARNRWDKTPQPVTDCPTGQTEVGRTWDAEEPAKQGLSHLSHVSHQESSPSAPTAAARQAEVSHAWADAFSRLSALYPDSLAGKLWTEVEATLPDLAGTIDAAERAADVDAFDYQAGRVATPDTFLACLATWEASWREAIAAATARGGACDDCRRADATVMVTTDTGRYCRRCVRPGRFNPAKGGTA